MFTIDSKVLSKCIDRYCKENKVLKLDFHKDSGVSSATLTQWRQGASVSPKSIEKLEKYLGIEIEELINGYSDDSAKEETDDSIAVRQMLRDRPEAKILFDATKDAPASALLEAAALIMRYKEESKYK